MILANPLAKAVVSEVDKTIEKFHAEMVARVTFDEHPEESEKRWKIRNIDHLDGEKRNDQFSNAPWTSVEGTISRNTIHVDGMWIYRDESSSVAVTEEKDGGFVLGVHWPIPETIRVQKDLRLNDLLLLPVIRNLDLVITSITDGAFNNTTRIKARIDREYLK